MSNFSEFLKFFSFTVGIFLTFCVDTNKKEKLVFKEDKIDMSTKLTRESDGGYKRKNVVFKVIMKDKKGSGVVIAQSICNLADYVYMPNKGNMVFEQKASLKFHKAHTYSNLLKQAATLNLEIRSVLKNDGSAIPEFTSQSSKKGKKTSRNDFDTSHIEFDVDKSMNTDYNVDDLWADDQSESLILDDIS